MKINPRRSAAPSGRGVAEVGQWRRPRLESSPGGDVGQAALGVVDQQKVDALALESMIIIEPLGVDEGYVALAVLGDDHFGASLHLLGQFGQIGARLGERHHIAGRYAHYGILREVTEFCAV